MRLVIVTPYQHYGVGRGEEVPDDISIGEVIRRCQEVAKVEKVLKVYLWDGHTAQYINFK